MNLRLKDGTPVPLAAVLAFCVPGTIALVGAAAYGYAAYYLFLVLWGANPTGPLRQDIYAFTIALVLGIASTVVSCRVVWTVACRVYGELMTPGWRGRLVYLVLTLLTGSAVTSVFYLALGWVIHLVVTGIEPTGLSWSPEVPKGAIAVVAIVFGLTLTSRVVHRRDPSPLSATPDGTAL